MESHGKRDKNCQLQVLYDSTTDLKFRDRARNIYLRLLSALDRRLLRLSNLLNAKKIDMCAQVHDPAVEGTSGKEPEGSPKPGDPVIREGDVVEVLPHSEILETLDKDKCYEGLEFFPGMEFHCGKKYYVLKRVKTIFDERAWRMVRIKNTVLLKDVICDGRNMYEKEGCDRCCYYFWKERWLRKV